MEFGRRGKMALGIFFCAAAPLVVVVTVIRGENWIFALALALLAVFLGVRNLLSARRQGEPARSERIQDDDGAVPQLGQPGPAAAPADPDRRAPAWRKWGGWAFAGVLGALNLFCLAICSLLLLISLPGILRGTSDDWLVAFGSVFGGVIALVCFLFVLPAQLVFAFAARSVSVWVRAAILLTLIAAILVGAAPWAVHRLKSRPLSAETEAALDEYLRNSPGSYRGAPAEGMISPWTVFWCTVPVTYGIAGLAYLLVYRKPSAKSQGRPQ